ncbi:MAG TPA: lysophospholipid acyltransferase family protein [Bryobacteraceae bacterium]|nr:lysophospholipid acyltransferase family protein [Bryobacteraceae bacterium]
MNAQTPGVFDAARAILEHTPGKFMQGFLLPAELDRAWITAAGDGAGLDVFARFLGALGVNYECAAEDLARIPAAGPVVLVANHPFGLVEGAIFGALLARVRPDFRFLANSLLADIPALQEYVIAVNPFGGAARSNWKSLRASIDWLQRGGMLVTFPAGEVSSLQFSHMAIADPAWNENITRLIQITGAASVPAFFHGTNGPGFHLAGMIHPRLRTALLPRELLNKRGRTIRVSIGKRIGPDRVAELATHAAGDGKSQAIEYLRNRTHVLQARETPGEAQWAWRIEMPRARIAGAVDPPAMRAEMEQLDSSQRLIESGGYAVCTASAGQIPNILREIGRLREIAFRQVGEGTGRSLDLDKFDSRYQHLWIWNSKTNEVVGAYRLQGTDAVRSPHDLYTSTLFRFRPGLLERFHPALELGRSFVRPEYQRSYVALLLLWKGIGQYVARNPRYRVLFGPVSISRAYNRASRELMVGFLKAKCGNTELATLVKPKRQFRSRRLRTCDTQLLGSLIANVDELSDVVSDLEPDGKGVPVLVRQYLNVGGQILAFNVDPGFSDVVDGLVMVDLARMDSTLLEKYLGKAGAQTFSALHAKKQNM